MGLKMIWLKVEMVLGQGKASVTGVSATKNTASGSPWVSAKVLQTCAPIVSGVHCQKKGAGLYRKSKVGKAKPSKRARVEDLEPESVASEVGQVQLLP